MSSPGALAISAGDLLARVKVGVSASDRTSVLETIAAAADSFPIDARLANAVGLAVMPFDPESAAAEFRRALLIDASAIALWLNLANACRASGRTGEELEALDQALALDPYQPAALAAKAYALERKGDLAESASVFAALISAYPLSPAMPDGLREAVEHGQAMIARHQAEAAKRAKPDVESALEAVSTENAIRAQLFADIRFGRKRAFLPQPTSSYYPHLPAVEFFNRAMFAWFADLEAATDKIADELANLLADATLAPVPYVRFAPGEPVNQWADLNHSPDWSAFFLKKDGVEQVEECSRCPATAAVINSLPLMNMEGKAPTVLFSILQPQTRIPPHTGSTNVRATVHLPLIVPPDCGFRVGAETREWRYGEAWAFDDTIEHEAWNNSDRIRAILILDAWNPFLSEAEQAVAIAAGA